MHDFNYKKNTLYCEKVSVAALAKEFGTPLYVYSYNTLINHYSKLKIAFRQIDPIICYSVKANSNLSILRALVNQGAGLDIVSGGELFRALKAGCPPGRIVYASVGKTEDEIAEAIKKKILFFNVESQPELESINRVSKRLGRRANVAIRINPDVEPKTHKFITTGKLTNKFGVDFDSACKIISSRNKLSNVRINGLHIHIGSQITDSTPFIAAITKVINFIDKLQKNGVELEFLNIGGGLGIIYNNETPQTADQFARKILPMLKRTNLRIILEPGRFIVGNAGILVTEVLYVKITPLKKFAIVNAGMNDLIRPSLYSAYHNIVPVVKTRNTRNDKYDIVGPICESGDFFAKDRKLTKLKDGDHLAIMSAGAYSFSMSSNYNSRRRAQEVLVMEDKVFTIRKRESYKDLTANEILLKI